jgi:hypothetical protein
MNSPFASLFLDLQAHIEIEVPEVTYIEQDLGQLGSDDPRKMMSFPAVLLDFPETEFSNLQGKNQMALPVLSVILVMDTYSQTYNLAPLEVRKLGLEYLELEQKLYMAIASWESDYCELLVRKSAKGLNRNDVGLRVRELIFTSSFEDYSLGDNTPGYKLNLKTE